MRANSHSRHAGGTRPPSHAHRVDRLDIHFYHRADLPADRLARVEAIIDRLVELAPDAIRRAIAEAGVRDGKIAEARDKLDQYDALMGVDGWLWTL